MNLGGHAASVGVLDEEKSPRPLLEVVDVDVSYGPTKALEHASLRVFPGEVHALIGENGSGKSTLVKTISGIVRPGAGHLRLRGASVRLRGPREAQNAGIVTVFQETLVADELSVLDNLCLGADGMFRAGARRPASAEKARAHLGELGLGDLDLDTPLWRLSLSRRHLVAIARALMRPWSLLILDEATSALDIEDRQHLFAMIRRRTAEGRAVLYISHRMDEIEDLAAKVTVLRSGRTVGLLEGKEISRAAILRLMSPPSQEVRARVDHAQAPANSGEPAAPLLTARGVRLAPAASPFDLELRPGEVVGLAGLEGHGQVTFLRCLAGWERPRAGEIEAFDGTGRARAVRTARAALRNGIAYVPGDRKTEGIFAALSVLDNLTMPDLGRYATAGLLNLRRERKAAQQSVKQLRVRTRGLDVPVESLSGGNQQKVVLGRWIATRPRVLLLEDPMRGVDVTSKAEIMAVLSDLVSQGVSLVLLSTEVEELVDFCSRVAVFRDQGLSTVIEREDLTEQALVSAMLGAGDIR